MITLLQEDSGLIKIYSVCLSMSAIWRPTPNHDIGIDGQIEFLEPNTNISTGHVVAVQSKSGPSYFSHEDDKSFKYYPEERHRRYWKKLKIPVLLVLHNPDNDLTLFARVKPQLDRDGPIIVRKDCLFVSSARDAIIAEIEKDYEEFIDRNPFHVLEGFRRIKHVREGHKEISGIDFLLACTNRNRNYFEIRMCRMVSLFELLSEESGVSIGSDDHDYIQRNVLECHIERIVQDFLEEFDYMWYELHMVPDISVPLTTVGTKAIECMWDNLDQYLVHSNYSHLKYDDIQELGKYISSSAQLSSDRLDASDRLGEAPR